MRFFLALIIFYSGISVCFAQNTKLVTNLYSNYLRGLLYAEEGNFPEGLKELRRAKKLDPQSFHIRLRLASLYIRSGEIEKAEKELKEAKKTEGESFDASMALIFLYAYTQQDEELEQEYEAFLEKTHALQPEDLTIAEYLGQYYFYKKKIDKSIKIYEGILAGNPDRVDAIFWLGYLYEEAGKRVKSIQLWERGLEVDPDHAPILNSLGYIYAEEDIKLNEAERMVKKALTVEADNGAYWDSLGWVHYKQKAYKQAKEDLEKALSLVKDSVIYDHLGEVLVELDNVSEAVEIYREALSFFPDNKILQEKLEKYGKKYKALKN